MLHLRSRCLTPFTRTFTFFTVRKFSTLSPHCFFQSKFSYNILNYWSKFNFSVQPLEENTLSLLTVGDKQIYLVGTAHVSKKSAEQVKDVIEKVKPDTIFVELCNERAQRMWQKIYKEEEITGKNSNDLILHGSDNIDWMEEFPFIQKLKQYQKMFTENFGFVQGGEFIISLKLAKKYNIKLVYGDRDVRITSSKLNKGLEKIFSKSFENFFSNISNKFQDAMSDISKKFNQSYQQIESQQKQQNEIKALPSFKELWNSFTNQNDSNNENNNKTNQSNKQNDENLNTSEMWNEIWDLIKDPQSHIESLKDRKKMRNKMVRIRKMSPELVSGLVDERDEYMTNELLKCNGKLIVAVVGLGHMDGIEERFRKL